MSPPLFLLNRSPNLTWPVRRGASVAPRVGIHHEALTSIRLAIDGYAACIDMLSAVMCLDTVAAIAIAVGDLEHAAWCTAAVDGELHLRGQTRGRLAEAEHEGHMATLFAAPESERHQVAWTTGCRLAPDAIVAGARSWLTQHLEGGSN